MNPNNYGDNPQKIPEFTVGQTSLKSIGSPFLQKKSSQQFQAQNFGIASQTQNFNAQFSPRPDPAKNNFYLQNNQNLHQTDFQQNYQQQQYYQQQQQQQQGIGSIGTQPYFGNRQKSPNSSATQAQKQGIQISSQIDPSARVNNHQNIVDFAKQNAVHQQNQNTRNQDLEAKQNYYGQLGNNFGQKSNQENKNRIQSKNQDSFSQITGSILDEGVNTNMIPLSRTIQGSKTTPYQNYSKMPFSNYNSNKNVQQSQFFSNYHQQQQQEQLYKQQQQQPNLFMKQQQQKNNDNMKNSQEQQFVIRNKDTGEVYDVGEYNKIRDEEEANRFLSEKPIQLSQNNYSQRVKTVPTEFDNIQQQKHYSSSNNIYQGYQQNKNSQQENIPVNNPKTNNIYFNNINNNNKYNNKNIGLKSQSPFGNVNQQQKMVQNHLKNLANNNNSKSLSPTPHQNAQYQAMKNFNLNTQIKQSNQNQTQKQNQNQNQESNQNNNNNLPSWQSLLSKASKVNSELILMAKINDQNKCVELLDKSRGDKKADVNTKGQNEWTPLHYAALNGNSQLLSFFLYHEAIIDAPNKDNQTPLLVAALKGHEDVFQILVTSGADINHQDSNGDTALHYAVKNNHVVIAEILLKKFSINTGLKNKNGQTAHELINSQEIVQVFQKFEQLRKQQKEPQVQIVNIQQENIKQMFQQQENSNIKDKMNTDLKRNTSNNSNNKKSVDSDSTTNDNSQSNSFKNEIEKIGPSHFQVHGLIGKGSFGEVYLVEKKSNNMLYAMKVLHKSKILRHNLTRYALTERNVLSFTNHPFIVKMQFAFQTQDKLFLILDYCPGGDLGELLSKEKKFNEERVKIYLCEIILALEDLHKRDVIFRDLKPDNIVLDHDGHAMLTDFGLSKEGILDPHSGARSFCGSVAYLAPEMLKRCGHGKAVDWYLLGVVMYEFLVGIPPYYANNRDELFYNIEKAPLKLPSSLSPEAKSLLKALLQRNPAKRLGSGKGDSEEIKKHEFFKGINWSEVYNKKYQPPIPKRKIRISTKFDPNIFDNNGIIQNEKERIPNWTFVNPANTSG